MSSDEPKPNDKTPILNEGQPVIPRGRLSDIYMSKGALEDIKNWPKTEQVVAPQPSGYYDALVGPQHDQPSSSAKIRAATKQTNKTLEELASWKEAEHILWRACRLYCKTNGITEAEARKILENDPKLTMEWATKNGWSKE